MNAASTPGLINDYTTVLKNKKGLFDHKDNCVFAYKAFALYQPFLSRRRPNPQISNLPGCDCCAEWRTYTCALEAEQSKINNCEGIARVHNHYL